MFPDVPTAIDGSRGELAVRRIVVWRRLEPGDVRTPGTEIAPESPHVEARIVEVGIAPELRAELAALQKARDAATADLTRLTTRYEPAGVLLAIGGGAGVGIWLEYLPMALWPFAASAAGLSVAVGAFTRARRARLEVEAARRWRATPERDAVEKIAKRLTSRWKRFAERLRDKTGFRVDLRIGDVHEAERLVSIDVARITHPDTWRPDPGVDEVRYGWAYADGRVVEQVAILEDALLDPDPDPDTATATATDSDPDPDPGVRAPAGSGTETETGSGKGTGSDPARDPD